MGKYSYEGILRAVGRVLDEAEAKRFAISDSDDGLRVETFDEQGERQLDVKLGLGDLAEIVDVVGSTGDEPHFEHSYAHDEGTLHSFLRRREMVGATR